MQADGVGQREVLVREFAQDLHSTNKFIRPDRNHPERLEVFDQGQKLQGTRTVIPFEKPAMSLGHYQRARDQLRGVRKQPAEKLMVTVRSVHECDQC